VALVDGVSGAETTYGQLVDRVEALAAALIDRGFRRGEVAAICLPNCREFAIAFLGVARAGGASTTVNPNFTEDETRKQLADSGAVIAFATPELLSKVQEASATLRETWTPANLYALRGAKPPAVAIDPEDMVALPYSSGTAGAPKGVMLSHRNLVAMQLLMEPVERTGPDDVVIAVLPFFHIYGLSVILLLGSTAAPSWSSSRDSRSRDTWPRSSITARPGCRWSHRSSCGWPGSRGSTISTSAAFARSSRALRPSRRTSPPNSVSGSAAAWSSRAMG